MKISNAEVFVTCPGRNFVILKIETDQGVVEFAQRLIESDRELIEGANTDPTVSQILTLINGPHHYQIIREGSQLMVSSHGSHLAVAWVPD